MTDKQQNLYILIPVFNEKENVPGLVENLRKIAEQVTREFTTRVIFVDDGSTDGTKEYLDNRGRGLKTTILSRKPNRGPGAAFGDGFEYLHNKLGEYDWVVTMEGDNTSRTDTLDHMLRRRREGYDVVLASPYAYGGGIVGVEWKRVYLSHAANALAKAVLGLRGLHTLSSFFRLYSGSMLKRLQNQFGPRILEFSGFECMVEMLLKLVVLKAKISEVETQLDWRYRRGKSKMRLIRASWGYVKLLYRGWGWRSAAGKTFWRVLR